MTVSHMLSVMAFHIVENKDILKRLRTELKTVMPDPGSQPKWNQLEKLPYLVSTLKPPTQYSLSAFQDIC